MQDVGNTDVGTCSRHIDDISDKKTLDKLLNDIGYDKGRETAERNRVHSSVERGDSKDQRDQLQGSLQDTDEENVGLRFRSDMPTKGNVIILPSFARLVFPSFLLFRRKSLPLQQNK